MDDNQESYRLLQDISKGSRRSFDVFYEKYIHFVYNIAFQIVKEHGETEDLCHDIFLEIFQKANQYDPTKGSVKAWLAVKTKSRAIDRLRKKKPLLNDRMEELLKEKEVVDVDLFTKLEQQIVKDALQSIPKEQREVLVRSYFRGETHKDIAKMMNKPLGSIKSLIRYGLNNLRKQKSLLHWEDSRGGGKHHEM